MGLLGLGVSLFPDEILQSFGTQPEGAPAVLIQLAGVFYMSFALLNWMAREKLIGGIYSRPVAMGNVVHFLAGSIVFVKHLTGSPLLVPFSIVAGVYALFAATFGTVAFAGGQSCG